MRVTIAVPLLSPLAGRGKVRGRSEGYETRNLAYNTQDHSIRFG